jgi:hypothetical protein
MAVNDIEKLAQKVTHIIGKSSAAANALTELQRQRKLGNEAWLEKHNQVWFVLSKPKPS